MAYQARGPPAKLRVGVFVYMYISVKWKKVRRGEGWDVPRARASESPGEGLRDFSHPPPTQYLLERKGCKKRRT